MILKGKFFVYLLLLVVVLLNSGCSTKLKGMPDFARTQPEESMVVTHPDKMENDGGKIVVFTGVLPARFLVEVEEGVRGVWPLPGVSLIDEDAQRINGFCYSIEKYAFDKNPWGIPAPMQCIILSDEKTLIEKQYAFAHANKDGGVWMASPVGSVQNYQHTIVDDRTYDWEKFENDPQYAIELMKEIGKTLPVINEVWRNRIGGFDDVQEISLVKGDPKWETFRAKMLLEMGNELRLPDGEIVASYLSEDEMEKLLRHNPHITKEQRFLSKLGLPLGTPDMMLFGFASSVIDGGLAAFFDDRWNTCVARGTCQRRDLSEQVAMMYALYQKEHAKNMSMMRGGK